MIILFVSQKIFSDRQKVAVTKITGLDIIGLFSVRNVGGTIGQLRPDRAKVDLGDQINFILHNPLQFTEAVVRTLVVNGDSYVQSLISKMGWNFEVCQLYWHTSLQYSHNCSIVIAGILS